jgi:CubicO group peptidase (beta-lactamase class C family)
MNEVGRLLACGLALMAMVVDTKATQNSPSGINSDAAKAIDDALRPILSRYEIPGAAVAVTLNGRLMVARGYGFADTYTKRQISPDTQFRIARAFFELNESKGIPILSRV